MADTPRARLEFGPGCPDCARRTADLPDPLPDVGDDFDWLVRDYDGFRLAMMEDLAARVPERARWTPADVEVVLVEALAAVLDQLSDMADRVAAEGSLETARRPESVRRLLAFVGYDAARAAFAAGQIAVDPDRPPADQPHAAAEALERAWAANPHWMDAARAAGPREIHVQQRMVTLDDHQVALEAHPLVLRASASLESGGAWPVVRVAVLARDSRALDAPADVSAATRAEVVAFHRARGVALPAWPTNGAAPPTVRDVLAPFVEAHRLVGEEVLLVDHAPVGIVMTLSVRARADYFQSEVRDAIAQALDVRPGGFFEPGRLRFGEDLRASDVVEALTALSGVEYVCLRRYKRFGRRWPDQVAVGRIVLASNELAVCENNRAHPERGYYDLELRGGRLG